MPKRRYGRIIGIGIPAGRANVLCARGNVTEWGAGEVRRRLQTGEHFPLVDVREQIEWNEGHLPDAVHLPRGYLEPRIEEAVPDKQRPVLLCCASGVRSLLAAETLLHMGYAQLISMAGGCTAWKSAGLPTVVPRTPGDERRKRHGRI
jgi:rhodanese-related sulfurtransferase